MMNEQADALFYYTMNDLKEVYQLLGPEFFRLFRKDYPELYSVFEQYFKLPDYYE